MKRTADWFGWTLQFIAGLIAGAFFSMIFTFGSRRRPPLIIRESSSMFMLGAALIGAALASYYGDQLWIGSSYRVIPPDAPQHSNSSRRASFVIGLTGAALVLVAVGRTVISKWDGWFGAFM